MNKASWQGLFDGSDLVAPGNMGATLFARRRAMPWDLGMPKICQVLNMPHLQWWKEYPSKYPRNGSGKRSFSFFLCFCEISKCWRLIEVVAGASALSGIDYRVSSCIIKLPVSKSACCQSRIMHPKVLMNKYSKCLFFPQSGDFPQSPGTL